MRQILLRSKQAEPEKRHGKKRKQRCGLPDWPLWPKYAETTTSSSSDKHSLQMRIGMMM
jgi:hypothetical protein